MQNLSFILEGIKQVKFEDRPVPEIIDRHDVLVNVKYTGVCGSDVSINHLPFISPFLTAE